MGLPLFDFPPSSVNRGRSGEGALWVPSVLFATASVLKELFLPGHPEHAYHKEVYLSCNISKRLLCSVNLWDDCTQLDESRTKDV